MFAIIWRGAGILVPLLFFGIGYVVSFWFEDTRFGNAEYLGWTCFYSGIALTILGLGMFGPAPRDENNKPLPKAKHDFFFIPVIFWGLFLLVLGIYFNWLKPDFTKSEDSSFLTELIDDTEVIRTVNIYNGSSEDLIYELRDLNNQGVLYTDTITAFLDTRFKIPTGTYSLVGRNLKGQVVFNNDIASDIDLMTEDPDAWLESVDGEHKILIPETDRTDDYDEAWMSIDGLHDYFLLEVTSVCNEDVTMSFIESVNWENKIVEWYKGHEFMSPLYGKSPMGRRILVKGPWVELPLTIEKNDKVYALVSYRPSQQITQAFLEERVGKLCRLID